MFAKSDIQPLLNQGASKADISASIFQAVVDQTVSGLAQGRRIKGNVLFLGGPLYFLKGLRLAFCRTLGLDEQHAIFPETAPCFMSIGAALYAAEEKPEPLSKIRARLLSITEGENIAVGEPLFASQEEYLKYKGVYVIDKALVLSGKPTMRVMHPLPRVGEITEDVDELPQAAFFREMENGMYTRMAIIALVTGTANEVCEMEL